jgi:hypothetical protein
MAREGLPYEPVMQKPQEGRRARSEDALASFARGWKIRRAAHSFWTGAEDVPAGDPAAERQRTREVAMWARIDGGG